jgi:hypothetical protein
MRYIFTLLTSALTIFVSHAQTSTEGATDQHAGDFATSDGKLENSALIEYLLVRNGVGYQKVLPFDPDALTPIFQPKLNPADPAGSLKSVQDYWSIKDGRKAKIVEKQLAQIQKQFPGQATYDAEAIQHLLDDVIEPGQFQTGPLLIRKNPDELGSKRKAKGAVVQYVNNRLKNGGETWNGEGALIYRVIGERDFGLGSALHSDSINGGVAVYWNAVDSTENSTEKGVDEVEELQLSLPVEYGFNKKLGSFRQFVYGLKPYYHTDFDVSGETIGGTLKLDAIGDIGPIPINRYKAVPMATKTLGEQVAWKLRLTPKVDYSDVREAGDHTTRKEDDDWFRYGGEAELSFRFFGENSPLEASINYQSLTGDGDPENAEMLTATLTRWYASQTYGITLEYKKGETPISQKDIDKVTVGLEIKM